MVQGEGLILWRRSMAVANSWRAGRAGGREEEVSDGHRSPLLRGFGLRRRGSAGVPSQARGVRIVSPFSLISRLLSPSYVPRSHHS